MMPFMDDSVPEPKWVVSIGDDIKEVYHGFRAAKTMLLSDLSWLAIDTSDEEVWEAWRVAQQWELITVDTKSFHVDVKGVRYALYKHGSQPA